MARNSQTKRVLGRFELKSASQFDFTSSKAEKNVKVAVMSDSATPRVLQFIEFSRPEYWSGWPFPFPGDLPNPGIIPRSPALQADSLPSEPPGKPKNTGVGSLLLLQGNFLTQESNWVLLYCRRILYQLSYQGSPKNKVMHFNYASS